MKKKTPLNGHNKENPPAVSEDPRTDAALEPDFRISPLAESELQKGVAGRILIRVTAYRKKLGDEDGLCAKYHIDCLRYAGILHEDSPGVAKIEVGQKKVGSKEEEFTQIDIYRIQENQEED